MTPLNHDTPKYQPPPGFIAAIDQLLALFTDTILAVRDHRENHK